MFYYFSQKYFVYIVRAYIFVRSCTITNTCCMWAWLHTIKFEFFFIAIEFQKILVHNKWRTYNTVICRGRYLATIIKFIRLAQYNCTISRWHHILGVAREEGWRKKRKNKHIERKRKRRQRLEEVREARDL